MIRVNFTWILPVFFYLIFNTQIVPQNLINNKIRLAQTYERQGDLDRAEEIYIDLLKIQPWNLQFIQPLNKIYLTKKNYEASIQLIEKQISRSPSDPTFYGMLGSTFYTMGDSEKAFEIWDSAIEKNENNISVYRIIANYIIENRDFDKAIEVLRKGKGIENNSLIFSFDLANLYSMTMKYSEAAEEYCDILLRQPSQLGTVKSRISNYVNNHGAFESTITVINSYLIKSDPHIYLDLLSFLYIQKNMYAEALKIILKLDAELKNDGAVLFNFAKNAQSEKEYGIASESYKILIEKYPNSPFIPSARINYVSSLKLQLDDELTDESYSWLPYKYIDTVGYSRYNQILEAYEYLIKNYPNPDIQTAALLGYSSIIKEKYGDNRTADSLLKIILLKYPLSPHSNAARFILSDIALEDNRLDDAKRYLELIVSNGRAKKEQINKAEFELARIAFWKYDFSGAMEFLKSLNSDFSDNISNDAIELGMIITTFRNDSLNLVEFAKAEYLAERKEFSPASLIFHELSKNKNLFILRDLALYKYAIMQFAESKYIEGINALQELNNSDIISYYSDKALFLTAKAYQYGLNDTIKAADTYKKLLEKFPNSLYFGKSRQILLELNTKES